VTTGKETSETENKSKQSRSFYVQTVISCGEFPDPAMRISNALTLVLPTSAILYLCSATLKGDDTKFSTTQATVQPPCTGQNGTSGPAFPGLSPDQIGLLYSSEILPEGTDPRYTAEADFSQRLAGGILRHFEFGIIVVEPAAAPGSVQPTALTTDAIITSTVRSEIAGQPQLPPGDFEIQTNDGVVTIRSKEESLDQAAAVINLALRVPDVRQIVYTMPSSVWRTAGETGRRVGVRERRFGGSAYDLG
jgi:BON domain